MGNFSVSNKLLTFVFTIGIFSTWVCAAVPPASNDWRFMSFEQRHARMTFVIHPSMMERFQEFYKTAAPELTCRSCHGENPERALYKLSNSELIDLEPGKIAELYEPGAELTPEQHFKRDNITPNMARLLGVPSYDPKTGLGFSCFGCHPKYK